MPPPLSKDEEERLIQAICDLEPGSEALEAIRNTLIERNLRLEFEPDCHQPFHPSFPLLKTPHIQDVSVCHIHLH